MTPPQPAGAFRLTGINYGDSSTTARAQADASTVYASLVARAATSSMQIAPVMDSTRRFPGVYTCIPYCNLGGGVLTLDAQGDSSAYFIFVTSGYLAASPASQMALVNGARASNGVLSWVMVCLQRTCIVHIHFLL